MRKMFQVTLTCLGMSILMFCALGVVLAGSRDEAQAAAAGTAKPAGRTLVKLETSMGNIYVMLNEEKAPETCANFKQYVEDGFYDGTIFHRVINDFMIQGGGMDVDLRQKETRAPIINESNNGLPNEPYSIAMARLSDPHSATSQFFINVKDNAGLNYKSKNSSYQQQPAAAWGYAVFGKVIKGKEVVDKIKAVATGYSKGQNDVPTIPVLIKKATVVDGVD